MAQQVVQRVKVCEANDGYDSIDVWGVADPHGDHVEIKPGEYVECWALDMEPGRWWKALDAAGELLAESSNEREVRLIARKNKGATLHCAYTVELIEWRREVPK